MPSGSEPASASVSPSAISFPPEAMPGSHVACCSGVPATWMGMAAERLDRDDEPGRGADATQLLDREAQAQQVGAEAPELLGERDAEDVVVGQELADVLGPFGRSIDRGGPRRDLVVGEDADGVAQEDLLSGEADRPVDRRIGGHRGHPSSRVIAPWRPSMATPIWRRDVGQRSVDTIDRVFPVARGRGR